MSKQTIQISTEVLKWAADTIGFELDELAKEAGVSIKSITDKKSEKCGIRITKLKKIAKKLKRPLAALLLPAPPDESKLIDFRRLSNNQRKLSEKTYMAIKKARYWQSVSRELLIEQQRLPSVKRYSIDRDTPQQVASIERRRLGLGSKTLEGTKSAQDLYDKLLSTIESHGIFVHQFNLPIEEIRGFTLPDGPPHTIVVNTADPPQARSFTLLHEYAHILLQKGGICLPDFKSGNYKSRDLEKWCNNFSGAFLMPAEGFLGQIDVYKKSIDSAQIIENLSHAFKVSRSAVMIRIMTLTPRTSLAKYCRDRYGSYVPTPQSKSSGARVNPVDLCKSQRGTKFVKLVLDSAEQQLINYGDVIDYLDLDLEHLPELDKKIHGIAA